MEDKAEINVYKLLAKYEKLIGKTFDCFQSIITKMGIDADKNFKNLEKRILKLEKSK